MLDKDWNGLQGVGVILTRKGKVVMCQRLPGSPGSGFWQGAGGKIEPGESYLSAAVRELKEESGLDIERVRFEFLYAGPAPRIDPTKGMYSLYIARVELADDEEPQRTEPDKHSDWVWYEKEDALKLKMFEPIPKIIKGILYSLTLKENEDVVHTLLDDKTTTGEEDKTEQSVRQQSG